MHVIAPITFGAIVYVAFRSSTLLVFAWLDAVHLLPVAADLRAAAAVVRRGIPAWGLFSVPDGLWVYATTAAMRLVWRNDPDAGAAIAWSASAFVLATAAELGQALHVIPGVFDPNDVTAYVVATALAFHCTRRSHE